MSLFLLFTRRMCFFHYQFRHKVEIKEKHWHTHTAHCNSNVGTRKSKYKQNVYFHVFFCAACAEREKSLWLAFYVSCLTFGFIEPFGWWFRSFFFCLFYFRFLFAPCTNIRYVCYRCLCRLLHPIGKLPMWMHFPCKSITVDTTIYFQIEC